MPDSSTGKTFGNLAILVNVQIKTRGFASPVFTGFAFFEFCKFFAMEIDGLPCEWNHRIIQVCLRVQYLSTQNPRHY